MMWINLTHIDLNIEQKGKGTRLYFIEGNNYNPMKHCKWPKQKYTIIDLKDGDLQKTYLTFYCKFL